ncbi:succinyldiaminopimelate transaminase [Pseudoteredinibacter isoporae]|uniref:N-succinyldiaminopimelate aminotransferase n=1 Tax=Pseudoteredinibacter isoporae TaxID=570281 RepID=A0A7X0MYR3_9GAMM|nr:succinyldiaminopimelate transaminase [Pseudoteredinibacter isoporae]MBB6522332.1 N-succinyldiaminopimelate aminotransferase [Pseudoteredinibacter isoporae]NHO87865.1 succinyldiaminopimelate transaminase [Pseudoteredinibacter isoporae]NIB23804.1 succinyldiaminopimelate transaminase [Pseudoteredinibacter isoporae]
MNPDLNKLQPYPFEKLAALKAAVSAPDHKNHIALSIGEPKHLPPAFVLQTLQDNLDKLANYPATKGIPELRQAIADWLTQRFQLRNETLNPEQHVLPVNGTREALFAFVQAIVDREKPAPLVLCPNPFYQIYEGAALLAGAEPHFLNCTADNNYLPDFDQISADTWQRCQLLFICTPGNPTGAVMNSELLQKLIRLADEHDFIIASDECYSELYFDENNPPPGLLQACSDMGRDDYRRCVVFHSLSKRSNLPGLRSGFVAGDSEVISQFLRYRTYHGCAMALPSQIASIAAWKDEAHVRQNRQAYQEKFSAVLDILGNKLDVRKPDAGFYLWPNVQGCDKDFAQKLFAEQHITVLPGQFLARDSRGINPGSGHVRMALVAPLAECIEAAERIVEFVST